VLQIATLCGFMNQLVGGSPGIKEANKINRLPKQNHD
jgi:hypothetical protein